MAGTWTTRPTPIPDRILEVEALGAASRPHGQPHRQPEPGETETADGPTHRRSASLSGSTGAHDGTIVAGYAVVTGGMTACLEVGGWVRPTAADVVTFADSATHADRHSVTCATVKLDPQQSERYGRRRRQALSLSCGGRSGGFREQGVRGRLVPQSIGPGLRWLIAGVEQAGPRAAAYDQHSTIIQKRCGLGGAAPSRIGGSPRPCFGVIQLSGSLAASYEHATIQ